ncbi:MAG: biotin--[acetyl-CoA-carboxylase] ligase [Burkholderiaceae bacterium]|nr:MAG: biotin--[acetyl-CoA-carboxylase] ligase [Burkholderiaceae bacterium]
MFFNQQAIESVLERCNQLAARACPICVEVVAETASTNSDLMARAATMTQTTLLVAEHQTAGRGRAGRSWMSTPGGVLTFSLAWPFQGALTQLSAFPLVVGLAVAERLRTIGVQVQLKWPNDILKDGKKLGGILVESAPMQRGGTCVVIGLGLNLQVPQELEASIGLEVADSAWLAQMDRNQLLAELAHAIMSAAQVFEEFGFEAFVERWNALHAFAGLPVRIVEQGETLHQGIALGIDASGRLLLDDAGRQIAIHSGDVSLRPLA